MVNMQNFVLNLNISKPGNNKIKYLGSDHYEGREQIKNITRSHLSYQ